jgi:hypothetical protein
MRPLLYNNERARARTSDPLYETINMTAKQSKRTIAKKAPKTLVPVSLEDVQSKIIVLRNEPMILDRDVAMLYGVETREINQAVKNNPNKFPAGYTYTLNNQEVAEMRSKILTTSSEVSENEAVNTNFSKSHYNPTAFTEKGLYMMATILKSEQATQTTIAIIETFTKVRYLKRELIALHKEADSSQASERLKRFGEVISDIVMPDLETSETESTLELNFFIGKLKHTVKRTKKEDK